MFFQNNIIIANIQKYPNIWKFSDIFLVAHDIKVVALVEEKYRNGGCSFQQAERWRRGEEVDEVTLSLVSDKRYKQVYA